MSHTSRVFILSVVFLVLGSFSVCASPPPNTSSKISSSLALLQALRDNFPDRVPADAHPFLDGGKVKTVLGLSRRTEVRDVEQMRGLGVEMNGSEARLNRRRHIPAQVPWQALEALSRFDFVESIDSAWQPGVWPTLDLSAQSVGATVFWPTQSQMVQTRSSSTSNTVVADFDTGVDVFHPGLWRADGGTFDWIDVNGNLVFDPGTDAVDMNMNGVADDGETLQFFKAQVKDYQGISSNTSGPFMPRLDWLYNDANCNGVRDYGIYFGESAPTYGEQLFILRDTNGNGVLDPGEQLLALGSSRIRAMLGAGSTTFTRGVDLIASPPDTDSYGHGTAVSGILCGEEPWLREYVGISPQIDLLVADRSRNDFTTYIDWAESHGARVMLYEFGAWIFQFMDGTSPLEQAISDEWDNGIPQIVPAGNLANGNKHAAAGTFQGFTDFRFAVPSKRDITTIYLTTLWLDGSEALSFSLINPAGAQIALPGDKKFYSDPSGNLCWSYGVQISPKGTRRFDVYISGVSTGTWKLRVTSSEQDVYLHAYLSDNIGGWSGGAYFSSNVSTASTVSWPATADKALVVGSFSTRGINVSPGAISVFSGIGPRIDGTKIVDLCAPGNYDIFTICSKDAGNPLGSYKEFTGTSAAAPHAAAACAILLQMNPSLSPDQIAYLLTSSALSDGFTGTTPNDTWGYGKLDVAAAAIGTTLGQTVTAAMARSQPDEMSVALFAKNVVAVAPDGSHFYVEEPDRSSGIRVIGGGVSENDVIMVTGTMTTVGLERAVRAMQVQVIQPDQPALAPLGMLNTAVGNPALGARGPNNVGLLVTAWGQVVESAPGEFVIDDASGAPVRVECASIENPQPGSFVAVTGICSAASSASVARPVIIPRRATDIRLIQ